MFQDALVPLERSQTLPLSDLPDADEAVVTTAEHKFLIMEHKTIYGT